MAQLALDDVSFTYPRATSPALQGISLVVDDGELVTVVGPSGCGKTTLLRLIAGLEPVSAGAIHIGGDDVTDLSPQTRDVALVSQKPSLYPHLSVRGNIGFALKMAKLPKNEVAQRVESVATMLGLESLLDRSVRALSGGQQQRVSMGRALVRRPQVFLMDEPLSNLDAQLRARTRVSIAALQQRLSVTTLYITHDQTEALTLGNRIVVMNEGRIEQIGSAAAIYDRPASLFVAGFMGSPPMNLLPADADGVVVGFRPEQVVLAGTSDSTTREPTTAESTTVESMTGKSTTGKPTTVESMTVELVENLGSAAYAVGQLRGTRVSVAVPPVAVPSVGATVHIDMGATVLHRFNPTTGQRL